jgi:pSer/pThr/pTyr-binding forkhead associated (FHA) protein
MVDEQPSAEEHGIPTDALKNMLLHREAIPPQELTRAVAMMSGEILRLRRERTIATEEELAEPVAIQIGRAEGVPPDVRDRIGGYPGRINLAVDRRSGISRKHVTLTMTETGLEVADSSTNGTVVNGALIKGARKPITEKRNEHSFLFGRDTVFTLDMNAYRQAVRFNRETLQARMTQVMPTMEE